MYPFTLKTYACFSEILFLQTKQENKTSIQPKVKQLVLTFKQPYSVEIKSTFHLNELSWKTF